MFGDGIERVNNCIDSMYLRDKDGNRRPLAKAVLGWYFCSWYEPSLKTEKGVQLWYLQICLFQSWGPWFFEGMALSPRGTLFKRVGNRSLWDLACCVANGANNVGKMCIELPRHAVVNKNYVGCAPKCLTNLNQFKWGGTAFLSPTKSYLWLLFHLQWRNHK